MSFELKDGVNFPPEDQKIDEILKLLFHEVIGGEYTDRDILTFLKTGSGLRSQEPEAEGADDSNFGSNQKDRLEIIKKYSQTISFLWQDKENDEIQDHIEDIFGTTDRGINISEEIESGRNQELNDLPKVTKQVVYDLVDVSNLLENSEIVEFDTPEEIFFFILGITGMNKQAAYLNGSGARTLAPQLNQQERNTIIGIVEFLDIQELKIPVESFIGGVNWGSYRGDVSCLIENFGVKPNDLQKIRLK